MLLSESTTRVSASMLPSCVGRDPEIMPLPPPLACGVGSPSMELGTFCDEGGGVRGAARRG